jgi:hypothetical protein
MKISGKHSIEEINGVRCSVADKQATAERTRFLEILLEHNGYKTEWQKNIPPPAKPPKPGTETPAVQPSTPETYKVGVTDITFNVAIMIFSRKLKTLQNKVLLPTYWTQEDPEYYDWYWKWKGGEKTEKTKQSNS